MEALAPACLEASIELAHAPVFYTCDVKFKLMAAQAEVLDCLQLAYPAERQAMDLLNAALSGYSRVFATVG